MTKVFPHRNPVDKAQIRTVKSGLKEECTWFIFNYPENCALAASHSQGLRKLIAAGRSAGRFLLTVAAITLGVIGVYKARAMLDARATLYTANSLERASSPGTHATSETANPPTVVRAVARMTAAGAPAVTAFRDAPDIVGDERQGEISSMEADAQGGISGVAAHKGADARVRTVYVHRGAGPPSAYTVPRE